MSFKEFTQYLSKDASEGELFKTIFLSLLTSFIVIGILYFTKLRYIENFIPKYSFYLFFAILSYALILPSLVKVRSYKEFPCMSGMMIGMTLGMISGFLPGFYIGSTNGMFFGSIFGMSIGILFGIWNGKCCGVMGIMEGIMAGFMGGLMGAMTAIMMYNDNLKAAGIVVFLISSIIMIGLNFMIYNESKGMKKDYKIGNFFTIVLTLVLTIITIIMMVFGPRSILFQ